MKKVSQDKQLKHPTQVKKDNKIIVNYKKSSNYNTYHVDGIFGGITPSGKLHISPFIQRQTIPKRIIHELNLESGLGKEIEREALEGIVREVQLGLIMDIDVAINLRDWLNGKINEYDLIPKKKENPEG